VWHALGYLTTDSRLWNFCNLRSSHSFFAYRYKWPEHTNPADLISTDYSSSENDAASHKKVSDMVEAFARRQKSKWFVVRNDLGQVLNAHQIATSETIAILVACLCYSQAPACWVSILVALVRKRIGYMVSSTHKENLAFDRGWPAQYLQECTKHTVWFTV